MRNAELKETQAGIKISGRNINNLRYADDTTLMEESKEELKSILMKVKGENSGTSGIIAVITGKRVILARVQIHFQQSIDITSIKNRPVIQTQKQSQTAIISPQ